MVRKSWENIRGGYLIEEKIGEEGGFKGRQIGFVKEQNRLKKSAGLQIAGLFYYMNERGKSGGCSHDGRWRGRKERVFSVERTD